MMLNGFLATAYLIYCIITFKHLRAVIEHLFPCIRPKCPVIVSPIRIVHLLCTRYMIYGMQSTQCQVPRALGQKHSTGMSDSVNSLPVVPVNILNQ